MSKRNPKTTGAEWLYLSMASFNGSGYADKSSPQAYIESYKFYKAWRREKLAIKTLNQFPIEALAFAEKLVFANEAGHQPSQSKLEAFEAFKNKAGLLL